MAPIRQRKIDKKNLRVSNAGYSTGTMRQLGTYLCEEEKPLNFVVSGGVGLDDKYSPLAYFLEMQIGRYPIIVLHNNDYKMEGMVENIYMGRQVDTPLWFIHSDNPEYEPFFGMNEMQVIMVLRKVAEKMGYTIAPQFERIARAHLEIMKYAGMEISLTGLYYLAQFNDMGEFHDNIMELPCGSTTARRIWADIGSESIENSGQLDLFRSVVNNLAYEARESGWKSDNGILQINCRQAVQQNATLLLAVNAMYTEKLLTYLAEELKTVSGRPYILLIDDVILEDETFREYIRNDSGCYLGLISNDVVNMLKCPRDDFLAFAEKIDSFIFLKHGTGETAARLSEIMGNYDHAKLEMSSGRSKGAGSLFTRDVHNDVHVSVENRSRVMPEVIADLKEDQAIIFDARSNQIIYYN